MNSRFGSSLSIAIAAIYGSGSRLSHVQCCSCQSAACAALYTRSGNFSRARRQADEQGAAQTKCMIAAMLRWLVRIAVGFVALIVLLLATGYGYELISAARDARRFEPPGEM